MDSIININDPGHLAILLGTLVILFVVYFSFGKLSFIKNGIITRGVIIRENRPRGLSGDDATITIQFTTIKGKVVTFKESLVLSSRFLDISPEVEVIYDKSHPSTAHINQHIHLWFGEAVGFIGGSGMIFIGYFGT